jgi:hypothetical protein
MMFSEKELMFLFRLKRMNFVERLEAIGSLAPGDDEVELQEFRWLRDDILEFVKFAKSLSLVDLRAKFPGYEIGALHDEDHESGR